MSIRRIVPNIAAETDEANRTFYGDFLGLDLVMDHGWIATFAAPDAPANQVSLLATDPSGFSPIISIEVDDADTMYAKAIAAGLDIVYPITDEPWGVRRFFVRDPNGTLLNIVSHRNEGD